MTSTEDIYGNHDEIYPNMGPLHIEKKSKKTALTSTQNEVSCKDNYIKGRTSVNHTTVEPSLAIDKKQLITDVDACGNCEHFSSVSCITDDDESNFLAPPPDEFADIVTSTSQDILQSSSNDVYEELPDSPVLGVKAKSHAVNLRGNELDGKWKNHMTVSSDATSAEPNDRTKRKRTAPIADTRVTRDSDAGSVDNDAGQRPSNQASCSNSSSDSGISDVEAVLHPIGFSKSKNVVNQPPSVVNISKNASPRTSSVTLNAGTTSCSSESSGVHTATDFESEKNHVSAAQPEDSKTGRQLRTAYVAMYSYDADDGNYNDVDVEEILTFDVHDVIYYLGERRGRWMKGQLRHNGEIGWFPETHVREGISASSLKKPSKYMTVSGSMAPKLTLLQNFHNHQSSHSIDTDDFDDDYEDHDEAQDLQNYVAIYPYVATHDGDVTFNAGDTIQVLETDANGWWRGTVVASNQTGYFPGSYVKLMESSDVLRQSLSEVNMSREFTSQISVADSSSSNEGVQRKVKKRNQKKAAKVVSQFFSTLPRRFVFTPQSSTPDSPASENPMADVAAVDNQKEKKKSKNKKLSPTLPPEWINTGAAAGDADQMGQTNNEIDSSGAIATKNRPKSIASTSELVSDQLSQMLIRHSKSKDEVSKANTKRPISAGPAADVNEFDRECQESVLSNRHSTPILDASTSSPATSAMYSKKKRTAGDTQQFGWREGNQTLSKSTIGSCDINDRGVKRKPEKVKSMRKSMSTSDLTMLTTTELSIADNSNGQRKFDGRLTSTGPRELRQSNVALSAIEGTNECNFNTGKLKKQTPAHDEQHLMTTDGTMPDAAVHNSIKYNVKSSTLPYRRHISDSSASLSPTTAPSVAAKPNKNQTIAALQKLFTSKSTPKIEKTDQNCPDVVYTQSRKNGPSPNTESHPPISLQVHANGNIASMLPGEPISKASSRNTDTLDRNSSSNAELPSKPLPLPKPALLRRRSIDEVYEILDRSSHQFPLSRPVVTEKNHLQCNTEAKISVRPEFKAPFAKPPRVRTSMHNTAPSNGQNHSMESSSSENQCLTSISTNSIAEHDSGLPSIKETNERKNKVTGNGRATQAQKPQPLKPKPKLAMRVVNIEIENAT